MGRQSVYKRARHTVSKEKKRVILQYLQEHPDLVINSSITVIKGLCFRIRLKFALDILVGRRKRPMKAYMDKEEAEDQPEKPAKKTTVVGDMEYPPRPDVTLPPQKPAKS